MEEGQKLSKTELQHRATIKKLRQYIAESTKSQTDAKRRIENIEKDLSKAEDRAQRFEQAEKRALSKLNAQAKTEKDLGNVTTERDNLRAEVADLNSRLNKAVARAEAAERRAQMGSSEAESRRVAELKDDLASAKIEREISEEKLRREIRDLKEFLKGKESVAEYKRWSFGENYRCWKVKWKLCGLGQRRYPPVPRATLKQSFCGKSNDYKRIARENWNGIESSLISRLANVENERDEFARREGDLRRKVREANLKSKRIETEVENSHEAFQEMERDLEESRREVKKLSQRLLKAEADLLEAKQTFETERERQDAAWSQRLEEEKSKWHEQLSSSPPYLHPHSESPMTANRKSETLATMPDRPSSRRSPVLPLFPPGLNTPPRQSSYSSLNSSLCLRHLPHDNSSASLEISSVQVLEPEEYFTGAISPVTPSAPETHQSKGINDIVSASTVAAGPSVQLVERMSATVRRLENERAAFKDELVCITNQRDEARQEVVALMKEVEEKRTCDKRIQDLEAAVRDLDERYQTTLEMLGEKSELVEEQKADIQDLKKIYRELVESTMK
ncbi:LOW QUALITY PROTEIN: hypothetical protein CISG_09907 [Coccidioides immitis RMSCC 3703]|uniref:TATA element modulatory factor 1 TATA binding domain-containing protein n=1 Tax=Coccidioides immitis RMSCC 3703 TaxID=454286 RepID=A0A0J8QP17_COCIT|nr:LOW QUALITY PROTEIN: hypothetical protein CISG_09907 [Coccidioides immitis RMSCC 3703]